MQSIGFPKLAFHIARKDWAESRTLISGLTLALIVPALLVRFAPGRSEDFAKGLLAGLLASAGFGYAHFSFLNERLRGTLEFLLSLPLTSRQLVLAKYFSLYSMVLFTVSGPALLVSNLSLILFTNAAALFLATIFMATTVMSEKPWAPQIPFWVLLIAVLPVQRVLARYYPTGLELLESIAARPWLVSTIALLLCPMIVWISVGCFRANSRHSEG